MNKVFTDNGCQDYVYWQTEDRKTLKKINRLLDDISRNGIVGLVNRNLWSGTYLDFGAEELTDAL